MYTLAEIITQCRYLIGDTDTVPFYADEVLTDFINRAIEDISIHFPRRIISDYSTVAGQHEYETASSVFQIFSLEYPKGSTPPTFLTRRSYTDINFYVSDLYYDFVLSGDADSDNPPRIILSKNPTSVEVFRVEVAAYHNPLLDPGDETTVPEIFIHLIGLFVRWKVWQERASSESMDPDPLHILSQTQELNATRAERAYRTALAEAVATHNTSAATAWKMDSHDRIY